VRAICGPQRAGVAAGESRSIPNEECLAGWINVLLRLFTAAFNRPVEPLQGPVNGSQPCSARLCSVRVAAASAPRATQAGKDPAYTTKCTCSALTTRNAPLCRGIQPHPAPRHAAAALCLLPHLLAAGRLGPPPPGCTSGGQPCQGPYLAFSRSAVPDIAVPLGRHSALDAGTAHKGS
jgi:hypothetical protein